MSDRLEAVQLAKPQLLAGAIDVATEVKELGDKFNSVNTTIAPELERFALDIRLFFSLFLIFFVVVLQ